jgi:hypothetical protein
MKVKDLKLTKKDLNNVIDVSKLSKNDLLELDDFAILKNDLETKKYLFGKIDIEKDLENIGFSDFQEYCDKNNCFKLEDNRYLLLGI